MDVHPSPTPPSVSNEIPLFCPSGTHGTRYCFQRYVTSAHTDTLCLGKDKCSNKFDIKNTESRVRDVGAEWMDSPIERCNKVCVLTSSDGADRNSLLSQVVVYVFGKRNRVVEQRVFRL